MPKVQYVQATYQVVVASVQAPKGESKPGDKFIVDQFAAPPGFRLHSFQPLKETVLVGQPLKIVMVFENATMVEREVPEPQAAPEAVEAQIVEPATADRGDPNVDHLAALNEDG